MKKKPSPKLSISKIKELIKNEKSFLKKNKDTLKSEEIVKRNKTFLDYFHSILDTVLFAAVLLEVLTILMALNLAFSSDISNKQGAIVPIIMSIVIGIAILPLLFLKGLLKLYSKFNKSKNDKNKTVNKLKRS